MSGDKDEKREIINALFDNDTKQIKPEIIDKYIDLFEGENKINEKTVETVFRQFPDNSDLYQVLAKVIVLNNRYSAGLTDWSPSKTNVDVLDMAKHIVQINANNHAIDECFDKDKAVETIGKVSRIDAVYNAKHDGGNAIDPILRQYNVLSFASKYCIWTWMVKDTISMPILDSYVAGMLYFINKTKPFTESFGQEKIKKDYGVFYKVYTDFVDNCMPDIQLNNKQIDEFLWQCAKSNKNSGLRI